ncbi:aldo/keto reductase [Vreelandella populi]|uniref:Aldo/keto reductase n=1 Tax=Vreelandella populi TaxID=2498858 RepID=A0A433L7X6_9GAMM|nr:aldo/keto reductase [Halomonas populi]RUR38483.1 aldo/keto reductase [Halomonas populi]RUR43477.1 aldo/keto reductase [Halomonas populi]
MSMFFQRLKEVSSPTIGLGCMNLSHGYGQHVPEIDALRALHEAFEMGYRHFDTATLYGGTTNERLLGNALKDKRQELLLASKCGMAIDADSGKRVINGRPEILRQQCEASLARLKTDHIDVYYLHRLDRDVPVEESVGALGKLVDEGKIGGVGLSEVSAQTLHKAHKEYPIAAVQSEYSLWTRNPEIALINACQELNVALVAFSPLGRGFLAGAMQADTVFGEGDMRANMPRFNADNLPKNLAVLSRFQSIAQSLEVTPAQLALAWVKAQGSHIVPIPGTCSIAHMRENLAANSLTLDSKFLSELNLMMTPDQVAGKRYSTAQQMDIDTEEFGQQ